MRHRDIVRKNFSNLIAKLQERSIMHDLSKLQEDEFDGFVEADSAQLYKDFASKEYHTKLKENKGIALHLSRNRHHPDMFPNGVSDMSFIDILEMVVDWKSASETYGTDFIEGLKYSFERFNLDEKQRWLVELIAKDL